MSNKKFYNTLEICEKLNISEHTLLSWYRFQRCALKDGSISKPYLPEPIKDSSLRGKPRRWSDNDLKMLQDYQKGIVVGRYGKMGKYSNPLHKTKEA